MRGPANTALALGRPASPSAGEAHHRCATVTLIFILSGLVSLVSLVRER
jgi:hypothetical protein